MDEEGPQRFVAEKDYLKLADEYDRLRKIYEKLKTNHARCKLYVEEAATKYEAARNVAKQWRAWYDKYSEEFHEFIEARKSAKSKARRDEQTEGNVTSSQTTECGPAYVRHENTPACSSDEPEVVSVRSLKRKRSKSLGSAEGSIRVKVEPTTPTSPIELASENFSSPALKRTKPVRTETSDLDVRLKHLSTPRKKLPRAQSEEATRPTTLLAATSSLSDGDAPGVYEDATCIKTEPLVTNDQVELGKTRDSSSQTEARSRESNVLRQRSVNIPSMTSKSNPRPSFQRKQKPELAALAEDGEEQMSQTAELKSYAKNQREQRLRLDTLLDVPSPGKQPLEPRPSSARTFQQPRHTAKAVEKHKSASEEPARPLSTTFKRPSGLEKSPPPPQPEDEPLRARPLNRLGLNDFKINPNYLGSKYAFADTFRGREQRRCLPGCTRPDCCGTSFKKAVEAGMIETSKTDDQVLEEYLGPDWATHMYALGPDKRKDLITQARAYAFSREHGKHRDAFARRSTPPGFWRVDMPSTQEEAQDRARAIDLEREKVEDRWREAMRGGRWIFRDES